jgi:hypothetical protein
VTGNRTADTSAPLQIVLIRARDSGWLTTAGRWAPAKATAPTAAAAARLSIVTSSSPGTAGPPWTTAGRFLPRTASRTGSSSAVVLTVGTLADTTSLQAALIVVPVMLLLAAAGLTLLSRVQTRSTDGLS